VPFYNEARGIVALLTALKGLSQRLVQRAVTLEVVLVDDGSSDDGAATARRWTSEAEPTFDLRLLRLSRNFGKEHALTAGLEAVDADAVVLMDADLQHPVEVIETFIDVWRSEGCDIVYARRSDQRREGLGKRFARACFYGLINTTSDVALEPHGGDFRLMSRKAYEALLQFPERERLMKGLYGLVGFPTRSVAYEPPPRKVGESKFSTWALWAMGLDGIVSFSMFPLRLTLILGVGLGFLAFGYGVWTIIEKLVFGIHVPGYPTLIVIISTIGAAQLIGMGVIGEYLAKVLSEVKRRPHYILQSDERYTRVAAKSADRSLIA
jgi:glycosyltransferase involved in cell wall biosynthesis